MLKLQKILRNRCATNKEDEMKRAYDFIKITLLGLIVGVLIILLLQMNFWGEDIKRILRKSVLYQNNENRKELLEKNTEKPPSIIVPSGPKYRI